MCIFVFMSVVSLDEAGRPSPFLFFLACGFYSVGWSGLVSVS